MRGDLDKIFKAYDIRGVFGEELDEEIALDAGAAFAAFTEASSIVVGRDMRPSSPQLAKAFIDGVTSQGTNAVDVGEVSTDALYFASGRLDMPGAMFTASHNPPRYNGIKLCKAGAVPVGQDSGLQEIKDAVAEGGPDEQGMRGEVHNKEILTDYARHCLSFIDVSALRPLKVAIDAGNGMAGETVPLVFKDLPIEVFPLYFDLDGTFPNHPANPIEPENLEDLRAKVLEEGCDVGIAFDGDADRCFLVDEHADLVSGSLTTALVAKAILEKHPGSSVIYNLICSWTVPEVIRESGGVPIRSRVGHSFIKAVMAETGAIFGGEHSGHYYFRDNYRADSGMIAALFVLEQMSTSNAPLSESLAPFKRYAASGEINREVADADATLKRLAERYADLELDWTDGLTAEAADWWFNCRPSNTEPLLRLNLEAVDEELMEARRDEVLGAIEEVS